ncbi:hypothetical protein [Arthrobacter sp. 35/47]|uniref:hypothetical protein n=1 Tax=Arthrobacter sp. 35/47 TaxID=269454 RepID=UPI0012EBAB0E|nr:hypothetical protein [Arthrobacter sp. 35/47]
MGKVRKVNVAAAKAQRDILLRDGKPVPRRIELIASYKGGGTLATKPERGAARTGGDQKLHSTVSGKNTRSTDRG